MDGTFARAPFRGRRGVVWTVLAGIAASAAVLVVALHHSPVEPVVAPSSAIGESPTARATTQVPASLTRALRFPTLGEQARLLPLLKAYLDGDAPDAFTRRIELLVALRRLDGAGVSIFGDVEKLKVLIYAARPFEPFFEKKRIPKSAEYKDADIVFSSGTNVLNVAKWGDLRFGMSLPKTYQAALDAKTLNRVPPFPMIVVLHGKEDYAYGKQQKPFPGEEAIKRLYPKASMAAVTEKWLVYAPVWPKGKWVDDAAVRKDRLALPLIFRHFHVDFDRMVIEGGPEALLYAAAYPIYFAGCIVHGDASDVPADLVRNLDNTAVYVVQTSEKLAPVARTLTDGGHAKELLANGPPTGLPAWLANVRRMVPKSFKWVVKDKSAHRFAYWMNLDLLDEATPAPTIEAEIVDTKEDPNTVRIRTIGVREFSLLLNDSLIDLDREVRVVVNDRPVAECHIEANEPNGTVVRLPAKFERTLDGMFDRKYLSIRKSQMYGWIFPVVLETIAVPGDAPTGTK